MQRPPLRHDTIETGTGPVRFWTDGEFVRRIDMGTTLLALLEEEAGAPPPNGRRSPLSAETRKQLREYFRGKRIDFDLPFALQAAPFTTAVLEHVARIPYGETLSYGEVAAAAGNPRAARAVGQAVGANPLPILIPCHRVLAAHHRLGGFGCGLETKRFLLTLEGTRWREATPA